MLQETAAIKNNNLPFTVAVTYFTVTVAPASYHSQEPPAPAYSLL